MQRNWSRLMGVPSGGAALGIGGLAQEQPRVPLGIPFWVWILLFVLILVLAVIWVLRQEKGKPALPKVEPAAPPPKAKSVAPAAEAVVPVEVREPELATRSAAEARPPGPDDLRRIEGVGPKIARLLQAAGITSFAQLAGTDVGRLRGILDEAGISRIADPGTWPEQAKLAADGDWAGLEALQNQLKGGRRVES